MSLVFRPLNRVLVDTLIATILALFILSAVGAFDMKVFFQVAVIVCVAEVLIWFIFIRNFFSVTITQEKIFGPSPFFCRAAVNLSDLNRARSEERSKASIWWGYRDLWSKDLKYKIRLWRRLLGRRQIYKIWSTLGWGDQPGGNKPLIYYPPYSR